jgi:23S rRNA pseudouridine1911/1915/1917 synthase
VRRTLLERIVEAESDEHRIDAVLASWLGEPRSRVAQRLAAGEVLVGGEPVAKSHRLQRGDHVEVLEAPPPPPASHPTPEVPIRYEDPHLVVLAKPAGLIVHPGAAGQVEPTLVDALRAAGVAPAGGGDPQRPGIVHRLDRGTSGLVVVTKTPEAYTAIVRQLQARAVARTYWALVEGIPTRPRATIDAPIARSATHRTRFAVSQGGRPAVTHYDVEESLRVASVLRVQLETGRTHQVRVHLSSISHPVVGDLTYGGSHSLAEQLDLARPALHARRLAFTHPITGEPVDLEEPLPADLTQALEQLRA